MRSNVIQFNGGRLMESYKKRIRESIHQERDEKRTGSAKYPFILTGILWVVIIGAIVIISKIF
ncbi:MAG: hypothetical protein BWX89_00005 [candidate division TA06 bacterium ADurb.Bin131]|jgi:hypothetical protein|uniref:Stress-associated endoplasmic reticulum protein n=1 Tax=candidate division TA06 bacterium ADurb.Bin131 TaxID=1852827 RepID=A0A1V6CFI2_UNCT6|nr:MAG: hypothetical protein BWX89_00005 [candidate division TA06 bacterium ADurb.Bin131]